jgi:hypothetical protein
MPTVRDPDLERQGRRLGQPGWWLLLLGALTAFPGVILVAFADSWAWPIGITLLVLASGYPHSSGRGTAALESGSPLVCTSQVIRVTAAPEG